MKKINMLYVFILACLGGNNVLAAGADSGYMFKVYYYTEQGNKESSICDQYSNTVKDLNTFSAFLHNYIGDENIAEVYTTNNTLVYSNIDVGDKYNLSGLSSQPMYGDSNKYVAVCWILGASCTPAGSTVANPTDINQCARAGCNKLVFPSTTSNPSHAIGLQQCPALDSWGHDAVVGSTGDYIRLGFPGGYKGQDDGYGTYEKIWDMLKQDGIVYFCDEPSHSGDTYQGLRWNISTSKFETYFIDQPLDTTKAIRGKGYIELVNHPNQIWPIKFNTIESCYIPANNEIHDVSGTYVFTENCHWKR